MRGARSALVGRAALGDALNGWQMRGRAFELIAEK